MRIALILLLCLLFNGSANAFQHARDQLRIVGSSTLYPFITIAAEKFGKISGHTPVVEATGTGGGFRLLCSGNSLHYPDIVNASRPIKPSELALCKKNSVNHLKEITIGYDGIVVAESIDGALTNLNQQQLFLALAKKVPSKGEMIDNPYQRWQQIDSSLPDHKIEVYGPSFTSGTRDAFIELVMHEFCDASAEMLAIVPNKKERLAVCSILREDGNYIEMSENDNLIIQKLLHNNASLGIISFSLLSENPKIKPIAIDHILPTAISIINKKYPLARPLFLYINLDHLKQLPSLANFINEVTGSNAIGKNGYLTQKGLLPIAK